MVWAFVNSCKKNQYDDAPRPADPAGLAGALYVHVPFCRAKCRYCDFYSHVADEGIMDAYVEAVLTERRLREDQLAGPVGSIFFGGGTPTALGAGRLARLLRELTPLAAPGAEISVESNPGTIDRDVAEALVRGGVSRVTVGAQSFDDEQLALLGRIHRAAAVRQSVEILRSAGVENLALDLIYAIPGQSPESWRRSLAEAVALRPQHISCYALSFEAGTSLNSDLQSGVLEEVDEEVQRGLFDQAVDFLTAAGYEHYELSNFALPGYRCRHNLVYWRNESYLGFGPGACSYVHGIRRTNLPDTTVYTKCLYSSAPSLPPSQEEHLTGKAAMAETLMLSLRLIEGVEIRTFQLRFGLSPLEVFRETFTRYLHQGAVEVTKTHVKLSRESLFTANFLLADLLAEADRI